MRSRYKSGASLIEVLTVIVVFLVGILAVVRVFPPGLSVLRETRDRTLAVSLARAEAQRVLGQSAQLPDQIVPAGFDSATDSFVVVPGADPDELVVQADPNAVSVSLDSGGLLSVGGTPVGHWSKVTGPNRFTRVIGEGRPVPQPTAVNGELGSPLQLMFAPIFHLADASGLTRGNILVVYGDDLTRRDGSSDDLVPSPTATTYPTYQFYTVPASRAQLAANRPFATATDTVWVPRLINRSTGAPLDHAYRIEFTYFAGPTWTQARLRTAQLGFDGLSAPLVAVNFGNYVVADLAALLQVSGVTDALAVELSSVRVQRRFREIGPAVAFDPADPYQFRLSNRALGRLVLNPAAASETVVDADGARAPLTVKADYTVYDWRIIRDEFTVPRGSLFGSGAGSQAVKLLLNSIRPGGSPGVDGQPYAGIALASDTSLHTPQNGPPASRDFVLVDVATGGVVEGNGEFAGSAYVVDKSNGSVRFLDTDTSDSFEVTGRIWLLQADGTWALQPPQDLSGRQVRALYTGRGEIMVQTLKAASIYAVVDTPTPAGLSTGQAQVGVNAGTAADVPGSWGRANRLYFPLVDRGQKVTVGEAWVTGPGAPVIRDRDYRISGTETILGQTLAYVELPSGNAFDFTRNGYAVRRVLGASLRVRAFRNPESFQLTGTGAENFERFVRWSQRWTRVETETFDSGVAR